MIKYKFLKYTFFSLIFLALLIAVLLIRITYKPLKVEYFLKYIDQDFVNNVLPKDNLNSATVSLNLFENTVTLNFDDIREYKIDSNKIEFNMFISSAKNINVGINAIKLFKGKFDLEHINIVSGDIATNAKSKIFDLYKLSTKSGQTEKSFSFPSIKIQNSNIKLNIKDTLDKIIFSGVDLQIKKSQKKLKLYNVEADEIIYEDNNENIIIKTKLAQFDVREDLISGQLGIIDINTLKSKDTFKSLQNLNFYKNNLTLKETRFKITLDGKLLIKTNYESIPIEIEGSLSNDYLLNADIDFKLADTKIPKELLNKKNPLNLSLTDTSDITASGFAKIKVFQNKLLAGSLDMKLKNSSESEFFISYDNFNYPIKYLTIRANILENEIKIENCTISNSASDISVKGKIDNLKKSLDADLEIFSKNIEIAKYNYLFKKIIGNKLFDQYKFLKFDGGTLKDANLSFKYSKDRFVIKSLKGDILKTKILFDKNLVVEIKKGKLKSIKESEVSVYSENISLSKNYIAINLKDNDLKFNNDNKYYFVSKLNTSFSRLSNFLNQFEDLNFSNIPTDHLEGNLDVKISLENTNQYNQPFKYKVAGKLNNFYYQKKEKKFPIKIENLNGNFLFEDGRLKVSGNAEINKSFSKIEIKLSKNEKLLIDIDSIASASSFNFLNEYNFLKSGTTNLKIRIEKNNLRDENWSAQFDGDLYNNNLEIGQVFYTKKEKEKGYLKARYYFKGDNLIKVENLTLITNDIIIRGDIMLDEKGFLKKINIKEFIRELDNYQALISFEERNNIKLFITGSSININNYFSDSKNGNFNSSIKIETDKLYLNGINFGSTKLESSLKRNEISVLTGELYYLDKSYASFDFNYGLDNYSKFNINFKNFGLFLLNLDLSNKFLKGSGDLVLNVDNTTKKIKSGEYLIKNFSIKDASFLARLLQLASFTGLLEILASDGIPFTNLEGSFNVKGSQILIEDTRFEGLSLGASTKGVIDLEKKKVDIKGVLIPAYAINDIINKIPLLGKIITGIEGEGIIGFNYKVFGSYENPDYSINPFSVLTPGIIRSIFDDIEKKNDNNTIK